MSAADGAKLREALALIEDRKHWTQGVAARDKWSRPVSPLSERACRWCVYGALEAVGVGNAMEPLFDAAHRLGYAGPASANDHGNHDVVMDMFWHAIALAEAES